MVPLSAISTDSVKSSGSTFCVRILLLALVLRQIVGFSKSIVLFLTELPRHVYLSSDGFEAHLLRLKSGVLKPKLYSRCVCMNFLHGHNGKRVVSLDGQL
jgi:hypothetical protein